MSDWLQAGGTVEELTRLVEAAPEWQPIASAPKSEDEPVRLTDMGNGKRFAQQHGQNVRYCWPWSKWLVWDGRRWAIDESGAVVRCAKAVVKQLYSEAGDIEDDDLRKALVKHARDTEKAPRLNAMLDMARSEPGIPIQPADLDKDPWLFNCVNGTMDLRTGELHGHRREDFITKLCPTPYDPGADCPTWLRFIEQITAGDRGVHRYHRRAAGMSLTGVVRDHVLFFCYGTGANGKTTYLTALQDTMGPDYAMKAPPDLLLTRKAESHPTERADLAGKRFVACIEAGEGRRLAESLVKELTGGDRVRARRMREDFWEFAPTHKLWLAANHKPIIRGTDLGIWRRIKLIPFTVTIPPESQDKTLPEKLRAEASGILAWAVLGCIEWQREGFDDEPAAVKQGAAAYRAEMDIIGGFLDDCCLFGDGNEASAKALYTCYLEWAKANGEKPVNRTAFGYAMQERGLASDRITAGVDKGRNKWLGICLRGDAP